MSERLKVLIIAPSLLPVPAVKGGAVETLVNLLIDQNEIENRLDLTVISVYDKDALAKSKIYKHTKFLWIRTNSLKKVLYNRLNYHLICPLFHRPFINYWQKEVIRMAQKCKYDKIVLEDNIDFVNILGSRIERLYSHIHVVWDFKPDTF